MTDQERLAWIEQQLAQRETQHRMFKRDRDEITLSIGEVRFLMNRAKLGQAVVDMAGAGEEVEVEWDDGWSRGG